jgi:cell division protein FtsB
MIESYRHPLKREVDRLKEQVERLKDGQRYAGEIRRQAFLELAVELLEMSPEERERALRRIVDNE